MLAKAGKRTELCWLQFGQCSSNLYLSDRETTATSSNGPYGNKGNINDGDYCRSRHNNNLSIRGHVERPRPRHPYRAAFEPTGCSSDAVPGGSNGFSVAQVPVPRDRAAPISGEGINCCSLTWLIERDFFSAGWINWYLIRYFNYYFLTLHAYLKWPYFNFTWKLIRFNFAWNLIRPDNGLYWV